MTRFTKEAVEASGCDWADAEELNETLELLIQGKLSAIGPEGHATASKLAWKVMGFRQVLLYRAVMLGEGCAANWNARLPLPAALCARAIVETVALAWDFQRQLSRACEQSDLDAIDELVMRRSFGTRLPEWVNDRVGMEAVNVLGAIDKLDRHFQRQGLKGIRSLYDMLSEMCHPNAMGTTLMFGDLDQLEATVVLSDTRQFGPGLFSQLGLAVTMLRIMSNALADIDALIPTIATMQEAEHPIPRPDA